MDTIIFAAHAQRVGVRTADKRLVWRTSDGDYPMEFMPVPPADDPDYAEHFRRWRSAAMLKWGMMQVVGAHGEDMPAVEAGTMPHLDFSRRMGAFQIIVD